MMPEIFLDTSYAIALSSKRDRFHRKALELAEKLEAEKTKLITTRPVMLEIGNALSALPYRSSAVALLDALEADPNVGIAPLTESLYMRGFDLFRKRQDKTWGIVDCISFVVMRERKITDALTTDEHFRQAGFRVLLRE
ncbi:type II toxin-antitoxin system VapC family toxin [Desulfonema magnum]|uniref:Ribonuclease VapC n=1 Tax=Desulfonema magnum TaxID=45655 RepID=A0A975BHR8_9BACT|nr:PIN domain-containing protein [Desulfonema magnum]QTA85969.1 PIN domain-containing protein [Desulfonema magnum]